MGRCELFSSSLIEVIVPTIYGDIFDDYQFGFPFYLLEVSLIVFVDFKPNGQPIISYLVEDFAFWPLFLASRLRLECHPELDTPRSTEASLKIDRFGYHNKQFFTVIYLFVKIYYQYGWWNESYENITKK